ncbi:MAG: Transketolase, C-terminal section [Candidatus Fermentimicrarchaeum limneticum]|uniref:Transketolase, C-terminal section n=1 Tax=Fermentimicrarchaeum limneticum TaxID=2795018 RepID=A0A7D6BG56_FERL1|nr:MAG: Transketolase, C-terminal section [Candidatus Fermentimicrarchaeum limneticum]
MANSSKINKEMALIDSIDAPQAKKPSRDGFGKALVELGAENTNVWVMTADVSESTRTHWFAEKFPERFVQVGVAEQNLAGVAAGIASCGKTVFISAYGVFSPGRNWDQLRVAICYNDVPVKLHGSHTGITVGPDGASHQALEDIAIVRVLPNITVIVPADAEEARKATLEVAKCEGPAYIRTCREKMPIFTTAGTPFAIGKANVYRFGDDVAIFACGPQVYESILAAEKLESEGISCAVVDCHTIKPIDVEAVKYWAGKTKFLVSVEEHQVSGGLGGALAEVVSEFARAHACTLKRHGINDIFCESGEPLELLKKYGLDADGIARFVRENCIQ